MGHERLDDIPLGLAPRDVAEAWGDGRPEEAYFRLVQQGPALFLVPRSATDPQQSWPEITRTGGFEWSRSDGALRCWRTPGQSAIELPLGDRSETASFTPLQRCPA